MSPDDYEQYLFLKMKLARAEKELFGKINCAVINEKKPLEIYEYDGVEELLEKWIF